jgi:hypothetical protein
MDQQNNIVVLWFKETFTRFLTESPTYFKIWSWISGILLLITQIPEYLAILPTFLKPSQIWGDKINNIVSTASIAILIMSKMTTQSKITSQTIEGIPLKQTDPNTLPFTAAKEDKKISGADLTVLIKHNRIK